MRKKHILWILIILIPFVNASLTPSISNPSVSLIVGKESIINISFFNSFNYTLYNLSVEPDNIVSMNQIPQILPNQSIEAIFKLKADTLFNNIISKSIKFKYLVNIDEPPKTLTVQIKDSRYEPTVLEILQGDTIMWFNNGTVTHTVTEDSLPSRFSYTISINQSASRQFNDIETINYHDDIILFGGTIIIQNKTTVQFATDPALYPSIAFSIASAYPNSSVSMDIFETNFTVAWNSTESGALRIINNANEKAYNIRLSGEWLIYGDNNFNLNPGTSKLILFSIIPQIVNTLDTGKNYTRQIIVNGDNILQIQRDLFIYIPFATIPADMNLSRPEILTTLETLKKQLEEALKAFNLTEPIIIYRDANISIEVSKAQLQNALLNMQGIRDPVDKNFNIQKDNNDRTATALENQALTQNSTGLEVIEIKDRLDSQRTWIVFLVGFIVLVIMSLASIYIVDRYRTSAFKRKMFFNR